MDQTTYLTNIILSVLMAIWALLATSSQKAECSPGERKACYCYLLWLVTIVVFYFVKDTVPMWTELMILDVGNVAVFAAATYLAVERWAPDVPEQKVTHGLLLALSILVGWDIILGCVGRKVSENPEFRSLLFSPSLTVSTISLLGLSLVCFLRYRHKSIPFVVIATLYSILQVPAYTSSYLSLTATTKSAVVFYMLAVGKVLYTHSFLATLAYKRINRRTHLVVLTSLNIAFTIIYIFYRVYLMVS